MQPAIAFAGIDAAGEIVVGAEIQDRQRQTVAEGRVRQPKPVGFVVSEGEVPRFNRAGERLRRNVVGKDTVDLPENLDLPLRVMDTAFAQVKRDGL